MPKPTRSALSNRAPTTKPRAAAPTALERPDRVGRVCIAGYFDPAKKASLRRIQATHPDRSVQDLLDEALGLLFAKHNVPCDVVEPPTVPFSSYLSPSDAATLRDLARSSGKTRARLLSEALTLLFMQHR